MREYDYAKESWGELSTGESVDLYTLTAPDGSVAKVTPWGATLVSLEVPGKGGKPGHVVLGFDELSRYEENAPYMGSTVGRFANRIRDGKFEIDGETFEVERTGTHHLHGGTRGFSHRMWEAAPLRRPWKVGVRFRVRSPDGEGGFPGNLSAQVIYWLGEGSLTVEYFAASDASTHLNLTNHAYFNLGESGDVLDHELRIDCARILEIDEDRLPTGEILDVDGTPLDLRKPVRIGDRVNSDHPQITRASGFDHTWEIADWDEETLHEVALLRDPSSGRRMKVSTTFPGLHAYTARSLGGTAARGGGVHEDFGGICLETQYFPDTPNQPDFPSTRLDAGQVWKHTTVYAFEQD